MSVLLVPGEDLAHFPRRLALILLLLVPKVLEAVDEEVGDAFSWFVSLFQTMITRSFAILSILSLVVVTPESKIVRSLPVRLFFECTKAAILQHAEVLRKDGSAILNGSVSSLTASLSVGLASGLTVSSGVRGVTREAEKRDSSPPSPCSRGAVRGVPRD